MKTLLRTAALVLLLPVAAHSQKFGVRGGVSVDPTFAFGGVRIASTPTRPRPIARLTLDVGRGRQTAALFTLAIESPKLGPSNWSWSPCFGAGLTGVLARGRGGTSPRSDYFGAALALIFGAEHHSRTSFEIQVNIQRSDTGVTGGRAGQPRVHVAIGYRLH
jgi:hypothetical protein